MASRLAPLFVPVALVAAIYCGCASDGDAIEGAPTADAGDRGETGVGDPFSTGGSMDGGIPPSDGAPVDGATRDATQIDAGPPSSRHVPRPKGTTTAASGFYEYLPPGYDGSAPAPLLVFWHGLDEDGDGTTQLARVLKHGPPKLIENDSWPNTRPFIVLSPQNTSGCPSSATIDAFLGFARTAYAVDPKRIYLTGLSCGAIGSWSYLTAKRGEVVAASVLIAGDPGNAWTSAGCNLVADLALWSLHGDKDGRVAFGPDQATMTNLLACPQPPRKDVRWTPIADGGHDTWTKTYDLSGGYGDVYAWLLDNPKP